jgi:peptidoglycan hydrolase-like protein with peptidoglycan-binding domain
MECLSMRLISVLLLFLFTLNIPSSALADELTQIIQEDLTTLGYDTGPVNGELSTKTIIAISKFQSEHELEVTGEPSPQLAGTIKAQISEAGNNAGQVAAATTTAAPATQAAAVQQTDEDALRAAQQKCLQDKMAAAQEANKKKSGFGKLLRAASRTLNTFGSSEIASQVSRTSYEVYSANASIEDIQGAAKDLGLTESDIEQCRNP